MTVSLRTGSSWLAALLLALRACCPPPRNLPKDSHRCSTARSAMPSSKTAARSRSRTACCAPKARTAGCDFPQLARDFRLRVELRFLTDNGDSGVFVRALPDGAFARGWPNRSYQVQLLNPLVGGSLPPVGGVFRHGMPPGETALDTQAVRAAFTGTGEWQLLEIEVVGTELTVQLERRRR